jgi:hypothetical protein
MHGQQKRKWAVVESWMGEYEWLECERVEGETKLKKWPVKIFHTVFCNFQDLV